MLCISILPKSSASNFHSSDMHILTRISYVPIVLLIGIDFYIMWSNVTRVYHFWRATQVQQIPESPDNAYSCEVETQSITTEDVEQIAMKIFARQSGTVYQRDFALEANGGMIIRSLTSGSSWLEELVWDKPPELTIRDGIKAGQCWTLRSSSGQLGMSLATPIRFTNVTITHIPSIFAFEEGQAPKDMVLWGALDGDDNIREHQDWSSVQSAAPAGPPITKDLIYVPLARFTYDIRSKNHAQTFPVELCIVLMSKRPASPTATLNLRASKAPRHCLSSALAETVNKGFDLTWPSTPTVVTTPATTPTPTPMTLESLVADSVANLNLANISSCESTPHIIYSQMQLLREERNGHQDSHKDRGADPLSAPGPSMQNHPIFHSDVDNDVPMTQGDQSGATGSNMGDKGDKTAMNKGAMAVHGQLIEAASATLSRISRHFDMSKMTISTSVTIGELRSSSTVTIE
ncbi:hypothetical protein NM688_g1767 [Phlebia brevispora]|uniref:Uncharacterized protein n=1 Tax=Phlebia brevispora TaxID=194682 RepID=A0ACC1TAK9_9APHY|nr:hypothetical protein NM688_g1767 [Phlebia brevispora]